jgi:hypothetical protein
MSTRRRKNGSRGGPTQKRPSGAPTGRPAKPDEPVQIGKRPSSPGFLTLVGVMWVGVGAVIFLTMSWSWKLIPAILAAGIGFLFLRGAAQTVIRREGRQGGTGPA